MTRPDPAPEPQEPKEIRDFRERYHEALNHARVSAEHTATQGWQDLYTGHVEEVRKARDSQADSLESCVSALRQRLLTEVEEKACKASVAALTEIRANDDAFQRQVIDPIIQPMVECNAVIESARATARNAQREFPLHVRGLVESMETVIDTMPRVKFIVASGRLVVGSE